VAAEVLSAALLADAPGVYEVRARFGEATPKGDAVEVVVASSPRSSAPVTVAIE
jgi:hypothetical protein